MKLVNKIASNKYVNNLWFFPLVLLSVVLSLSFFKVSGSSVGVFHLDIKGSSQQDSNIIFGEPRPIRSDESTINTPVLVSQYHNNYERMNNLIGQGQDMSVLLDVPYREWSSIFKPQNWAFFIMPLENAFAFKWWFLAWGLVISCYLFITALMPKQKLFAALMSLSILFAPFVQWWYQTITIAPIAYCFLILAILLRLKPSHDVKTKILLGAALVYVLAAFALVLYPPFQIPCLLGVAVFYLGYLLEIKGSWRTKLSFSITPAIAAAIAGVIVGIFLFTRLSVIETITETVYPGHRIVDSGGFSITNFFAGPFQASLMNDRLAGSLNQNQSEASSFIMIWPALLLPSFYLIYARWKSRRAPPWALLLINILLLLLMARLFLPLPEVISKILFLESIPHNRLLIGIGFLALVQVVLLVKEKGLDLPKWLIILTVILAVGLFSIAGLKLDKNFPDFIPNIYLFVIPILAIAAITSGLLSRKPVIGGAMLFLFSLGITFGVNPLYSGLGVLTDSALENRLETLPASKDGSKWVFLDAGTHTNFLIAQGIPSYNATYAYPQLELWRKYDPSGKSAFYYNRYANVFYSSAPAKDLILPGAGGDSFGVAYDSCNKIFIEIKYVVAMGPLPENCVEQIGIINEPTRQFYIYRVKQ